MKIKKRFVLTSTTAFLIPFVITIAFLFGFVFVSSTILNDDINYTSFKRFTMLKLELSDITSNIIKNDSKNVDGSAFKQYLSQKISRFKGKAIVTKGDNVVFVSEDIGKIDVENCIEMARNNELKNEVSINNTSYMIDSTGLNFEDGTTGYAVLLAPDNRSQNIFSKLIMSVGAVFVISFIIINLLMSYVFSKRIIKPVSLLKNSASQISSGNLEEEIFEDGDDEIRELCRDFENMRIRLKNSVDLKMKYDDNRKALISSISHDLKTPITSIEAYVEGIMEGIANTDEKKERYLKTIYKKAKYVDGMIDDLLLYSKLEMNQIPFNFEDVDIVEYFKYCIYESAPELKKYNIDISLENDLKKYRHVRIDRERMHRVIINIIDNSRKYMDKENGKIAIILRETNLSIIIEIRDNGSGIEKNDVDKIFNRFYRADSARSGANGSGLGLAIAKEIVEGNKGRIWVVSHGNEGTSIMISLAKIKGEKV